MSIVIGLYALVLIGAGLWYGAAFLWHHRPHHHAPDYPGDLQFS